TESLALGGLGSGWGACAIQFTNGDMEGWPIGRSDLAPHYDSVAARVGISGARDDLLPYYGECAALQPPIALDHHPRSFLSRYESGGSFRWRCEPSRAAMNAGGLFMGAPRLAILTRDMDGRRATRYHEMDFYTDADRSVYRPWFTVQRMREMPNFRYERPWLV